MFKKIFLFFSVTLLLFNQLHSQTPVKVNSGALTATKTYMHVFVENPSKNRIAYRYFSDSSDQPSGRADSAPNCDLMLCDINTSGQLSGHTKLYDITDNELGHGSEAMIWIANDRLYYNGRLFNTTTKSVIWNKREDIDDQRRIMAWREPKSSKLYVCIRHGDDKGFYWLDPTSSSKPALNVIFDSSNLDILYDYWSGSLATTEPSYIYPSPDGSKLYLDIHFNDTSPANNDREYCFVVDNDGSDEKLLPEGSDYLYWDGHTVWYDNNTLIKGNGLNVDIDGDGVIDGDHVLTKYNLTTKKMIQVGGEGNHLSISPNKQWLVGDICHLESHAENPKNGVYLYKYNSADGTPISNGYLNFGNYHPSFSRDGNKVYFQAKDATNYQAMYYVDISNLINNKINVGKTEAEHLPYELQIMKLNAISISQTTQ